MEGALSPLRPLGRLARLPLRALPKRLLIPILSGPNRGFRWMVGAGIHGCWLGTYEREKLRQLAHFVRPGATIFDVGAHAGYYTLTFARLVGPAGRVFAFEPNPVNLANLRRHLLVNGITNVVVIEGAVSDQAGVTKFAQTSDAYQGKMAADGIEVRSIRLDDYGVPDILKMDIERAEGLALAGASHILAGQKSHLFISLHGITDRQCLEELNRHGYEVRFLSSSEIHAWPCNRSG